MPPWPWIAIAPATVAKFKYPAECVAHKCPGHPYRGALYYSLSTVGTLPAELHPAKKTHLHKHHGDLALQTPHGLATDPPQVLAPNAEPGIWFHDLPALATLRGTIAAVDAGTTPAGMAMVGVAQSGHEAYRAHAASRVGTSQEGEAMILLSYVMGLAETYGRRNIHVRSAFGSSLLAVSTRTLMAVIQFEGITMTLIAAFRVRRSAPRVCA